MTTFLSTISIRRKNRLPPPGGKEQEGGLPGQHAPSEMGEESPFPRKDNGFSFIDTTASRLQRNGGGETLAGHKSFLGK
jgi:hypothetical protein